MINERDFVMSLIAISQSEKMLPRTFATFTAKKNYMVTAKQQNKSMMRIHVPSKSMRCYSINSELQNNQQKLKKLTPWLTCSESQYPSNTCFINYNK